MCGYVETVSIGGILEEGKKSRIELRLSFVVHLSQYSSVRGRGKKSGWEIIISIALIGITGRQGSEGERTCFVL